MSLFRTRKKNRACVLGLDGVPHGLILDLARKGVMPAMGRLVEAGHFHRMKASLPEISAVSWTNFMTGLNPGGHGIFGFTDFKPGSYDVRFPNFLDLKVPTFWDRLGQLGKRTIVINQPSTYPARSMNGVLVSGFVALDIAKAVYPPTQRAALERLGYEIDIDTLRSRDDHEFLWQELEKTLAARQRALAYFWEEPWDFFELVVTGTDRLHHYLWTAYTDPAHPFHETFLSYYKRIDGLIDMISRSFREATGSIRGFYILSDHGFTGIVQEVSLNAWLESNGYLGFDHPQPEGLDAISEGTKAFALDPNRIYLNLEGRFPRGTVAQADRGALRKEIADKLGALEHEGQKVVRKVFIADEIYSGPETCLGPDLLVLGEPGFDMKGSVKRKEVFGRTSLQGMHTWDDAFFWAAEDHGKDLAIEDIASIILRNFT
jgi:predicted AlkP superfamily phosphohydrolase/phosphomutase